MLKSAPIEETLTAMLPRDRIVAAIDLRPVDVCPPRVFAAHGGTAAWPTTSG
jgi:hypothetical protein